MRHPPAGLAGSLSGAADANCPRLVPAVTLLTPSPTGRLADQTPALEKPKNDGQILNTCHPYLKKLA